MTRFAVIAHESARPTGKDRTTVVFSLRHKAGSLYDALIPFRTHGINLTRIESRPSKRRVWEYSFVVDFEGHVEDENVKRALAELVVDTHDLRILGSDPRAERLRAIQRPHADAARPE